MSSAALPIVRRADVQRELTVALVGNPNAGKTTLFNRLTGLRAKTANFPGTTVEHRRGVLRLADGEATLIDLPGLYSLDAVTPDERVARDALVGDLPGAPKPAVAMVVVDATNVERSLFLVAQLLELEQPTIVALNMIDDAQRQGLEIDCEELQLRLGCPVLPVSARTGQGVDKLREAISRAAASVAVAQTTPQALRDCSSCHQCQYAARYDWASSVSAAAVRGEPIVRSKRTEAIDRVLTHRVVGLLCFAGVMALVFLLIFWIAQYPMGWIDGLFGTAGELASRWLPEGDLQSFVADGLIGGVGGMLIFLPQICLLFFTLSLLEDSGYLARAAFVMDRLMYRVGLPGKAFVPLLSAHACAIPAIMSTRVIEDRRDRLATILVIPLMTCSARMPVYLLVTSLLFPERPGMASLAVVGSYALGIFAALAMAWVFKKSLLKGRTKPLVIELPNYRRPSLRNALLTTYDRAWAFVKNAGTTIMVIAVIMWALATYPKVDPQSLPADTQSAIAAAEAAGDDAAAEHLLAQTQLEHSFAGRIGRGIQPAFEPVGFDWRMSIGVVSSFAAREVIVSTLAVLYGIGEEGADDEEGGGARSLLDKLRSSRRTDGRPVFTTATCLSLLVFYVLAMQCLPTQAVTRRETGTWKWPLVQFGYMTALAYTAALVTYQTAAAAGW
ncbi:MAG: ferrous iron transport protein B [Planctomycetaceae bacterium]|nr:ferrous iron transport protein B [Planctomycetaceae bacterium]